jgi:(2Fe-2S) ferredoxin
VVYPQGTWYTYVDETDIDAIIDQHILGGQVVERLALKPLAL